MIQTLKTAGKQLLARVKADFDFFDLFDLVI
jgi:hypothetical protein